VFGNAVRIDAAKLTGAPDWMLHAERHRHRLLSASGTSVASSQ